MSIHREGYKILFFGFIGLGVMNIAIFILFHDNEILKALTLAISILFYAFIMFFFRLPDRNIKPDSGLIFAPADGKVVVIEETLESEYFNDMRLQVSIFMSPFNVHSNKYPVSGIVKYVKYHPGRFLVAWHPKSSDLNERASTVIQTEQGKEILIRQVAGAVARRIVTYSKKGKKVKQGKELGFIKFGSRVDLFLPLGTKMEVPILQQVRANKSVLARF